MKIGVFGTGYVGLSNAVLLAQKNEVVAVDIVPEKIDQINSRVSPIEDSGIIDFFSKKQLNLVGTLDPNEAIQDADFILIATPTNFDPVTNSFDTSSILSVIRKIQESGSHPPVIIRSTVPIGFTEALREEQYEEVIFIPEFLREGRALYDNLFPSRIVVGSKSESAKEFAKLLQNGAEKKNIDVIFTSPTEAECIKLFSNTYLAMRVAFFNELDNYAWENNLSSFEIIRGIGLDPRIGTHYCNPSFGYGGYCLPKDTKQLLANYSHVPQSLMGAIVHSNNVRKDFVVSQIIKLKPKKVGIYRLAMKSGSDNFRESSILDVMKKLLERGLDVCLYEPSLDCDNFMDVNIIKDFNCFIESCDLIISNRLDEDLKKLPPSKLVCRDLFLNN